MEKRITIVIEIDLPNEDTHQLPKWLGDKSNVDIEKWCDDKVSNFIRDTLECDFNNSSPYYTGVEEF